MFHAAQRGNFFSEHTLFPLPKHDSFVEDAFSSRVEPVHSPAHRPSGGRRKSLILDPSYNFFQDRILLSEPGLINAPPRSIAIFADLERIIYYSADEASLKLLVHEESVWKSTLFPLFPSLLGKVSSIEISEDDHNLLVIYEMGNAGIYSVLTGKQFLYIPVLSNEKHGNDRKWKIGEFSPDSRMLVLTSTSVISIAHRDISDPDTWSFNQDCLLTTLHPILSLDFVDAIPTSDESVSALSTTATNRDNHLYPVAFGSMPETVIQAALNASREYSTPFQQHKRVKPPPEVEANFRRYLLATACTYSLRIWDIRISKVDSVLTATEIRTFTQEDDKYHNDFISVGLAPNCRTLLIGHSNLNVSIWRGRTDNMRDWSYYRELPLPNHMKSRDRHGNRELFPSADSVQIHVSKDIVSTSYPVKYGTILIWDIKTGLLLHRMLTRDKSLDSDNNNHNAANNRDNTIYPPVLSHLGNSMSNLFANATTSSMKYAKVEPTGGGGYGGGGGGGGSMKTVHMPAVVDGSHPNAGSNANININSTTANNSSTMPNNVSNKSKPRRTTFNIHSPVSPSMKPLSSLFFQSKGFTMDNDGAVAVVVIIAGKVYLVRNNMHLYWKRSAFQFLQNPTDCPQDFLSLVLLRDVADLPICEEKTMYNVVAQAFQSLPDNVSFLKEDDKFGIKSKLDLSMILQLPLHVLEIMIDSDFFMHACIYDNLLTEFLGVETSLADRIISIPRMKLIISVVLRSQQAQESLTLDGIIVIVLLLLSMHLSWVTQHEGPLTAAEVVAVVVWACANCKLMHHQLHLIYFMIQQDIINMYAKEYWNYVDISVIVFTWTSIGVCLCGGAAFRLSVEYRIITAVTSGLVWVKLLGYIRLFGMKLSTFILSLFQIMKDIRSFMIVLLIFMMGFANIFFIIMTPRLRSSSQSSFDSVGESLLSMYRMMLGDSERDWFQVHGDGQASNFMVFMFVIYSFFVTVILLNILIAVISDSYDYSMSNAQRIYLRAKLLSAAVVLTKNDYSDDYLRILQKVSNDHVYRVWYAWKAYHRNVTRSWLQRAYVTLLGRVVVGMIVLPLCVLYCVGFAMFFVLSLIAYVIFDRIFVYLVRNVLVPAKKDNDNTSAMELQATEAANAEDMAWPGRALDMELRVKKVVDSKVNDVVRQHQVHSQQLESQINVLQKDMQSMKSCLASIQTLLEMQQQGPPPVQTLQRPHTTSLNRVHELLEEDL